MSEVQKSLETAEVAPTIIALEQHLETVRQTEVERVRRRQVSFLPEQQDAIEELTRGIVTRILLGPVEVLEAVSEDKAPAALLSMVHRIFNLGVPLKEGRKNAGFTTEEIDSLCGDGVVPANETHLP